MWKGSSSPCLRRIRPKLWIDIGDLDMESTGALLFENTLTYNNYLHEFHRFSGEHTEEYWSAHAEDYLRWYTRDWQEMPMGQ